MSLTLPPLIMATPGTTAYAESLSEQKATPILHNILVSTANAAAASGNTGAALRLATAAGLAAPAPTATVAGEGPTTPAGQTAQKATTKPGFLASLTTTEKVVGGAGILAAGIFAWKEWM